VVVVGSQSILGSLVEEDLPPEATMSVEIDILPLVDDRDEATRPRTERALAWLAGRGLKHRRDADQADPYGRSSGPPGTRTLNLRIKSPQLCH
jgi:hypothetical protein